MRREADAPASLYTFLAAVQGSARRSACVPSRKPFAEFFRFSRRKNHVATYTLLQIGNGQRYFTRKCVPMYPFTQFDFLAGLLSLATGAGNSWTVVCDASAKSFVYLHS